MPREIPFVDTVDTPTSFDFESVRISRRHPFEEAANASHVLVPFKSREVIAALNQRDQRIQFPSGEPSIYWKPQMIQTYDSEGPSFVEVMRTFSLDSGEDNVQWLSMLGELPAFFSKHFTSTVPSLWRDTFQGRFAIVAPDRTPLVTAHAQWRDSDGDRGVTMQYVIRDREHPMWKPALWTAFCLRP